MRPLFPLSGGGFLAFVLLTSTAAEPSKPAEQYEALLKQYQKAEEALSEAYAQKDYDQRRKFLNSASAIQERLIPKFLELAEKNPNEPVAVNALVLVVKTMGSGGKDSPGTRAIALLLRDHVRSDKLGPVLYMIAFSADSKTSEAFLRKVLEMNPHKDVQALACLSLAQFLGNRLNFLDLIKDEPALAKLYGGVLGKEYLEELQRQDRTQLAQEAETLFERAADKYADVKILSPTSSHLAGATVGAKAKAELFELRHLAVGKQAPDIEAKDQDGKPFKLSDYRGKVVLLDFWFYL
jgi:hypothetical protein